MTLRKFLSYDIEVDFHSFITDDWAMAHVGPTALTEEGEEMFASILDKEVDQDYYHARVVVETEEEDELVRKFFRYAAGYCSCETYDKLFKEVA